MVARKKMDSNETSLSYAEEISIGVLPGSGGADAVWKGLEPNTYSDFGGQLKLLARNPINSSRQRKKGEITDLDASGGFNQDFTIANTADILQGFLFADFRLKATEAVDSADAAGYVVASSAGYTTAGMIYASGFANPANNGFKRVTAVASGLVTAAGLATEASPPDAAKIALVGIVGTAGDIDVDNTGVWPAYTSTVIDFSVFGFVAGEWIFVGGDNIGTSFAAAGNNGFKRIRSITAHRLEIDQGPAAMVTAADTTGTIHIYFGRVLKNELGVDIKRRSYTIERQLGAPDSANLAQIQSETISGCVPATFTLNAKSADKVNADFTFIGTDFEQHTATEGLLPGSRIGVIESDAFNTSSDVPTMRLSIITNGSEAPNPLFAYLTDFTIKIDNHLTANKAIAVLGAFDITAGTFEVSASATAYFATVEAVEAVRDNDNVQLYAAFAKHNAGFVVDLPLVALSDARLNVTQDDPITLPLTIDAATAALINPATDYTMMWVFFDYLPTVAG